MYKSSRLYKLRRNQILLKKAIKRKKEIRRRKSGWNRFVNDIIRNGIRKRQDYIIPSYEGGQSFRRLGLKPTYSKSIQYLASKKNAFSNEGRPWVESGNFTIPRIFSLNDNYKESFSFLKRLFLALYHQSATKIILDYKKCERIDVDASVCMDILLGEFITYFSMCKMKAHNVKIKEITPINFDKEEIKKILFSIGAYTSIKGFRINYPDIIPYPLCFGYVNHPKASNIREVHITQLVEYVQRCMSKFGRSLTADAEANLFKVIGEMLINAEEHSSGDKRFSIGYFQDTNTNGEHIGIFNLVILNFGKTIYEKFSDPDCPNKKVVDEMKSLSDRYTTKGLFSRAEFEEQCLWTLYALQEGVTSKADWRRGNGSIRFIDSFFDLKGDQNHDNISYLSIVSGNTKIIFDGTYRLIDVVKGEKRNSYKMMTFNETGSIEDKPSKKYVTFVDNYFPGTIISAKICIKEVNTENSK